MEMVGVHLRIPDDMLEKVDQYAARRYLSRSSAIRQLLGDALHMAALQEREEDGKN